MSCICLTVLSGNQVHEQLPVQHASAKAVPSDTHEHLCMRFTILELIVLCQNSAFIERMHDVYIVLMNTSIFQVYFMPCSVNFAYDAQFCDSAWCGASRHAWWLLLSVEFHMCRVTP